MVKGVNKAVIEINLTESQLFERAILFVKPEKICSSEKSLARHAEEYIRIAELTHPGALPLPLKKGSKGWRAVTVSLLQWVTAGLLGAAVVFVFF